MTGKLKPARKASKSAAFPKGNPIARSGNRISAIMQAVKNALPAKKAAWALHCATGQPLSICQKVLSGHRAENGDMLQALLRSEYGWTALQALGIEQPWFAEIASLADIAELKRDQLRLKRDLDRREARLLEARAGAGR